MYAGTSAYDVCTHLVVFPPLPWSVFSWQCEAAWDTGFALLYTSRPDLLNLDIVLECTHISINLQTFGQLQGMPVRMIVETDYYCQYSKKQACRPVLGCARIRDVVADQLFKYCCLTVADTRD